MEAFLEEAKVSSRILVKLSGADKNRVLREMPEALRQNAHSNVEANTIDINKGEQNKL